MSNNRPFSSKLRAVIYGLLAFLVSLSLFVLSIFVTLEATFLNPDFIISKMDSTNYFVEKEAEVKLSLIDLGYASGLNEEFFENVVDPVMIHDDTEKYLEDYYAGESNQVDRTAFKQQFNTALDEYIKANNIQNVNGSSREYLVNRAAGIYASSLQMPLFITLSTYVHVARNYMPYIILFLTAFLIILCLVIILTNKWKHRALKYLCCATLGATLTVGIIPVVVFISGYIEKMNITSRSLYVLMVECANSIFISLAFCALFFLVVSAGLFFWYKKKRDKVTGSHH